MLSYMDSRVDGWMEQSKRSGVIMRLRRGQVRDSQRALLCTVSCSPISISMRIETALLTATDVIDAKSDFETVSSNLYAKPPTSTITMKSFVNHFFGPEDVVLGPSMEARNPANQHQYELRVSR